MLSSTDILQSTALSRLAHCNLLRSTIPVCFQLTFSCLLFTGICLFPVIISHFLDSEKPANTDVYGLCLTPRVGLEPTTTRLTAECSTIELSRITYYLLGTTLTSAISPGTSSQAFQFLVPSKPNTEIHPDNPSFLYLSPG